MSGARATGVIVAMLVAGAAAAVSPRASAATNAGEAASAATGRDRVVLPVIEGDGIPAPLAGLTGDATRGRTLVGSRTQGMCLLCHAGPRELFPHEPTPGTVTASLAGAGARWSTAQLRLRIADARRLQPDTPMPSYHRVDADTEDTRRVAAAWRGRPIFDAQQVEDVVAFLETLR